MLSAWRGSMPVRPVARAVSETPSNTHRRSVASRSSSALSASFTLAWLRTCAARSANLSVDSVSEAAAAAAETHATRVVLQFPPNESSSSRVSFESRYGMWAARPRACVSALITLPSAESDALILRHSCSRWPLSPLVPMRSDPAKSTRLSFATRCRPTAAAAAAAAAAAPSPSPPPVATPSLNCSTTMTKTACDRDDDAFASVAAVWR